MKNMSKNTKITIVAVIAIVIIGLIFGLKSNKKSPLVENPVTPSQEENTPVSQQPNKTKPSNSTPVDTRSYTELVSAYKGHIVQFGASCQVHMNTQAYKVGTDVLLDNRNSVALNVKIGPNSYNLGAYGYKVVSLDTEGSLMIDCNDHQNVATLIVQK